MANIDIAHTSFLQRPNQQKIVSSLHLQTMRCCQTKRPKKLPNCKNRLFFELPFHDFCRLHPPRIGVEQKQPNPVDRFQVVQIAMRTSSRSCSTSINVYLSRCVIEWVIAAQREPFRKNTSIYFSVPFTAARVRSAPRLIPELTKHKWHLKYMGLHEPIGCGYRLIS